MHKKLPFPIEDLISVVDFCTVYEIEVSFVEELQALDMIEIVRIDETGYVYAKQLPALEKMLRFRYELDINLEGIQVIQLLLNRISKNEEEISMIKNRLRFYEPPIYM